MTETKRFKHLKFKDLNYVEKAYFKTIFTDFFINKLSIDELRNLTNMTKEEI